MANSGVIKYHIIILKCWISIDDYTGDQGTDKKA